MLDFKKLAEGVKKALAKETTQSIDKWFEDYELESIQTYIGDGEFSIEPLDSECYCIEIPMVFSTKPKNNITEYPEYDKAA